MENNNQNSNTDKPMTAEEIYQRHVSEFKSGYAISAMLEYAAQQTAEIQKQLAQKGADDE